MPTRDYLKRLAEERYEGEIRNQFLKAVDELTRDMKTREITRLIQTGNIEGAVLATGIGMASFKGLKESMHKALAAAGRETTKAFPPARQPDGTVVKVRFNPGHARAVQAVNDLHTGLIREVVDSTRQVIRDNIRHGIERGHNPRKIARSIRGKYDYRAKAYRGGVIGLTQAQSGYVMNAQRQLRSGNTTELRKYLGRKLRDRRYDGAVVRAINEGTAPPERIINNAVHAYRRRYVAHRAETIARDQALEALTMGQDEAMSQAVEQNVLADDQIYREWVHAGDVRVRDIHAMVPAMNPGGVAKNDYFETPLGLLKRPRDRNSPGSVPENVILCRCITSIKIRRNKRG